MTIKRKILLPMVVLTIVVAAAILVSNIVLFSNYVDTSMEDRINVAAAAAQDKLASLKKESGVASEYIAKDTALLAAIASGDRSALLSRAAQLQNETGVEFCTITDVKGDVLLRAHEPEKYGDSVLSQANITAALSGKSLSAIEQGTAVLLSVRSGSPVFDGQGALIGAVSVGYRLDTDVFVDAIKSILNCEVTVFLGDERISTTVVKEDGTRAIGTKAMQAVSDIVLKGQHYTGQAQILTRDALTKYSPIYDAGGKVTGMLFVGQYLDEKTNTVSSFMRADLLIMLALLALSIPAILILVKRIVMPINLMVEASHALAAGDTGICVNVNTKDETRQLADAFNEMIKNSHQQTQIIGAIADGDLTVSVTARSEKDYMNRALETMLKRNNHVFSQIVAAASEVSSGARQIADSSQLLAQGASEQTASVEELSGVVDHVDATTTDNTSMADKATMLAGKIKDNAQTGTEQMEQMVQAVNEINTASESISKIMKVIDDIAFQTNILALNAAVEAARAGEHGKGFAVVAEEVRNLAAKSAQAAKDTGVIIEDSIAKAKLGVHIAAQTSASLSQIVSGINESGKIVGDIAKSSERQRMAIAEIYEGISQVTQVVRQNSAAAEEGAASSEEMSVQAQLLQELVSQFKLLPARE